uniref:Tc1-like transposase DDE domain-containing protein n=1 Tax=Panagrolaimus sp. ES5 TaxID=591445 RepID=A0AC34FCB0_9BILA
MISLQNRQNRLQYRQLVINQHQYFYDHVFVDESSLLTRDFSKFDWIPLKRLAPKHMRTSHSSGVIVYGGISRRGPTPFVILPNTVRINERSYCNIVARTIYPFIRDTYNMNAFVVQDSAPFHVSHFTTAFFNRLGLRTTYFPPQSPDFNPIEYVWRAMKEFVRTRHPRTIDQLIAAIEEFCTTILTVEYCNTLIEQSRINVIRSVDGLNWEGRKPTDVLYA